MIFTYRFLLGSVNSFLKPKSWFIKQVQQTATTAKKILAEKDDDLRAIWDSSHDL